ncbi:MAG: exosortase/archaeosortase family protein [Candidatus Omnitrophica bacterium]|nr:exosortase/archaeosortase family protein [Candidatus Omnitrophota bacterium]
MRNLFKWFIPAGLLLCVYFPAFAWMVDRWTARDSYYAHGVLIPLITLYWIWKKKPALASVEKRTEWAALPVILLAVLIQAAAGIFRVYCASSVSFVTMLFGGVLFLFGRGIFQAIWYPLAFLYLMIPLPLLVISEMTLKMKFFVTEVAAFLLPHAGIRAIREGSYIYTPHAAVLVGDPCSGLRSFLAFLCLGLIFVYGAKISWWKKIVLVLSGLPLAVLSNVARVFALSFLSEIYGTKLIIESWFHDASGYAVFLAAFAAFIWLRKKLEATRV